MKRIALAAATLVLTVAAHAQVSVTEPWVRATVPKQSATGAFMRLTSAQDVKLVSGQSPVAGVVEIHEMAHENNMMKMRELKGGLALPAGQAVELTPGGYHIMLMDLKRQVKIGETVPLTLVVEAKDGTRQNVEVQAPVVPINTAAKASDDQADHAAPAPAHGGMKH